MDFLENGKGAEISSAVDGPLYRALAIGDYPGAWLLAHPLLEPGRVERLSAATAFNCGLCLFLLEEYERALMSLKRAEQFLGSPAGFGAAERKGFLQAVAASKDTALLPLDPESGEGMGRYYLMRVRWLTALCLIRLDREQEPHTILRFLNQYHIQINC